MRVGECETVTRQAAAAALRLGSGIGGSVDANMFGEGFCIVMPWSQGAGALYRLAGAHVVGEASHPSAPLCTRCVSDSQNKSWQARGRVRNSMPY